MEKNTCISLVILYILHTSQCTPPKIITPNKQDRLDILADESYTLTCKAEGTSDITYQWRFNGDPVDTSIVDVDETTGILFIKNFKDVHEGSYQCYASSEISKGNVAVAMSAVITLRKVRLDSNWPPSSNLNVYGTEGDYFKLTCDNAPVSVPEAQFSWYLTLGEESEGQIDTNERIYIADDGTLHFMYLEREDQSDLLYKCGMLNSRLGIIKLGSNKNLTVKHIEGGIPERAPINNFKTENARFLRTREAVLECVFSGYPIPTTTWYDGKKELISPLEGKYALENNNRKLIISDLTEMDEGLYSCKGSNGNTEDDIEMDIFLDITSGPIWRKSLSSQTVVEGEDAVFYCNARAAVGDDDLNPPKWFKNGKPLPTTDTEKFEFTDKDRTLTVKSLDKSTDIMCFQCNVSNDIGYELADGCLNVIVPITVITQPILQQAITKGDYVNLTVIGTTDPAYTLQYRWYFRNVSYNRPETPPFVILNETSRHAYINTSDLTDEEYDNVNGTYIVELFHDDDKLNVSIEVILTEIRVPVTVVAAGVDLWWVALIVALVILLIVIIIIVVVCHRKRQEGIYPLDKSERKHDMDPEKELANSAFQDLSRAPEDEDYPYVKTPDLGLSIDDDDDDISLIPSRRDSLADSHFNEDGSFIGQYGKKK